MIKAFVAAAAITLLLPVAAKGQARSGAHVIVYKTKANYNSLVPVMLSEDKKTVVSYPDPMDVQQTGSGYPLPVLLHKGYLLDKRGIGRYTAFIRLTYKQYSSLKTAPSPEELYGMIVDKDPITELCDCGIRNAKTNSPAALNALINKGQLSKKCKLISR